MRWAASLLPWVCVGVVYAQPAAVQLPDIAAPMTEEADRTLDTVAELRRGSAEVTADARVDLRLLQRWLLSVAAQAEPMSDAQATALLRAEDVAVLIAAADDNALASDPALHRATFNLPDNPGIAELHAVLEPIGMALATQLQVTPPPFDPQPVSDLRRGGLPPAADLAAIADRLNVSAVLRRQLTALTAAATTPTTARPTQSDATAALALIVELIDGLERNRAVAAGERLDIETRLADGIALMLDPRTVDAGARRLSALRSYRDLIRRVDALALPEAEVRQLERILTLARGSDETAARMLEALDAFAEARAIADALDGGPLSPKLARQLAGMAARFEQQRGQVLEIAGEVGERGVFSTSPTTFARAAAEHLAMARALAALADAGSVVERLERAGVRPIGGLDQALTSASVTLTERTDADAAAVLNTIAKLGALLTEAEDLEVAPEVDQFLHGRPNESQALVRQGVIELGSALADGDAPNGAAVAVLDGLVDRWDRLDEADSLRRTLQESDRLAAWPDWPGDAQTLGLLVDPWRDALASTLVDLDTDGGARLAQADAELGPMLSTLASAVAAADELEALERNTAALAGLVTPPTDWSDLRRLRALVAYLERADDQQRALVLRTWSE